MATWFTSDTHFAHSAIVQYCARPFRDSDEMDRVMIERWNATVAPTDLVYHLGDFAFGPVANIGAFRARLSGRIHLIRGNHDRGAARMKSFFGEENVSDALSLVEDGLRLILTHRPISVEKAALFDYALNGHVHEKWTRKGNQLNVGVDVRGFRPVSLRELVES